ncbi:hypothetical protein CEXT_810891 [Caerostris extrusa]|uniref:Uncharacterized protein n=1 Tax=Caerostris extrusa TaxID=172846 RepID=A0AAV4MAB3_CAEEX|nr:hypothetical protein CEXT_810891 [Caerostris extrusa]
MKFARLIVITFRNRSDKNRPVKGWFWVPLQRSFDLLDEDRWLAQKCGIKRPLCYDEVERGSKDSRAEHF